MRKYVFLLCMSIIATGDASLNIPGIEQNKNIDSSLDQTLSRAGLNKNIDDVTEEQDIEKVQLSDSDLHHAKVWGITEEEEKRFKILMDNKSQVYYEGLRLTPIDILGINARNESERRHFAEISAEQEAQKVAQNIAWNNTFYQVYKDKMNGKKVIQNFNPKQFAPSEYKPIALVQGDVINLFIKIEDHIKTIIFPLVEAIRTSDSTQFNIFILNGDEESSQTWAMNHSLPLELVNSGRITINTGSLAYNAIKLKDKKTPLMLLSKDGSSKIIDLGSI